MLTRCAPLCSALGLSWWDFLDWGLGLTEVVGQLWRLAPAPIQAIKVVGQSKPWHLAGPVTQREF